MLSKSILLVVAVLLPLVIAAGSQLSVSGISSGAFMAVQYHVAHSSSLVGAGVVGGGPYWCAMDNVEIALSACMKDPELILLDLLYAATTAAADVLSIDQPANLVGSPVLLYSGTNDTIVNPGVMQKLNEYYQHYQASIQTIFTVPSVHGMITDDYGLPCDQFGAPFINNCNLSLAGQIFQKIYGQMRPRVPMLPQNLVVVPQSQFVPVHDPSIFTSLDDIAYVYYPSACSRHSNATDVKGSRLESTTNCSRIHVAFHGCLMTLADIGTAFVEHGGYLEWAEANNIVVLFPQIAKDDVLNPAGCWDWWGYSGLDFATKLGIQIATVEAMANWL